MIWEREQHSLCLFRASAAEGKHKTLLSHSRAVFSVIRQLSPASELQRSNEKITYTFVVGHIVDFFCLEFSCTM